MKLGRKPRGHDSRIPKVSALRSRQSLAPLPPAVSYASGLPSNLGAMGNDSIGDCTCAAAGHAIQVWSWNAGHTLITPPDLDVLELYETCSGYVPGDPATDTGCIAQGVLHHWLRYPLAGNTLYGYAEIDTADFADIQRSIWECGVVYLGFNVPSYLMNKLTAPGSVWDVETADTGIVGGHCVDAIGYDENGNLTIVSWGATYTMTPAFWAAYVDESYALVDQDWCNITGKTPLGLALPDLDHAMHELKA